MHGEKMKLRNLCFHHRQWIVLILS